MTTQAISAPVPSAAPSTAAWWSDIAASCPRRCDGSESRVGRRRASARVEVMDVMRFLPERCRAAAWGAEPGGPAPFRTRSGGVVGPDAGTRRGDSWSGCAGPERRSPPASATSAAATRAGSAPVGASRRSGACGVVAAESRRANVCARSRPARPVGRVELRTGRRAARRRAVRRARGAEEPAEACAGPDRFDAATPASATVLVAAAASGPRRRRARPASRTSGHADA